jgi:hypothetical protein
MSWARSISARLTYANVTATIALFVSLGGASYAALVLPPHSVGARQLRDGAVTPNALSFPIGVKGVTDRTAQDLTKGPCNSPAQPDGPPQPKPAATLAPCYPHAFNSRGEPIPDFAKADLGRELHVSFRSSSQVLASAIAGLRNQGPTGTSAEVSLQLIVDSRITYQSDLTLAGGQSAQLPLQALIHSTTGRHTIGIHVSAQYSSRAPGDVIVSPTSLVVSALPAL